MDSTASANLKPDRRLPLAGKQSKVRRSRTTNDPLSGGRASGKTTEGRRIRDLDYLAKLGNPTDPATQALCLAAASSFVDIAQIS